MLSRVVSQSAFRRERYPRCMFPSSRQGVGAISLGAFAIELEVSSQWASADVNFDNFTEQC